MLFVAQFISSPMLIIYSLEYSGILYMFMYPYPCQYGEPTDFLSIQFMQNIPSNGAGEDWLLTPSQQIILSPTVI
jgi:hypothetical protein